MILKPSTRCQKLKTLLSDKCNKNEIKSQNISYNVIVELINNYSSDKRLLNRLFKRRKDLTEEHYENLLVDCDIDYDLRVDLIGIVRRHYRLQAKKEECDKGVIFLGIAVMILGALLLLFALDISAHFSRPDTIQNLQRKIMLDDYNPKSDNHINVFNAHQKYKIDYQGSINQAVLENDYLTVEKILNVTSIKNMTSQLNATGVLVNATNNDQLTIELFNTLVRAGADVKSNCYKNSLKVLLKHCDWYPMMNNIPLSKLLLCSSKHQLAFKCVVGEVDLRNLLISFLLDDEYSLLTEIDSNTKRNIIKIKIYERIGSFVKNYPVLSALITSMTVMAIKALCLCSCRSRIRRS